MKWRPLGDSNPCYRRERAVSIKTVNALSHYTDWTIGHVHAGALGWVAMISIGTLYHMIPKLWGRERMHSVGLINAHFWLATIGTARPCQGRGREFESRFPLQILQPGFGGVGES